jgi:type II secretory pathway pseudopilin PulG
VTYRYQRGSVLVGVLLLSVVFLLAGIALTTQQRSRYAAVVAEAATLQALSLAESGLEDARIKLEKDPGFPPRGGPEQQTFTYTEEIRSTSGQPVGSYTVTVDSTYLRGPFEFYLVRSVGTTDSTRVKQTLTAEIDVATRTIRMRTYDRV